MTNLFHLFIRHTRDEECEETSQVLDEKQQEKEEGQGELRRRKVDKEASQE